MKQKQRFFQSVANAWKGLRQGIIGQRNIQIMLLICAGVIGVGFYYHITRFEWAVLWICMGLVLALELINTALETVLDHLHPDFHTAIGKAKDIAAGAVLIMSIVAGIAGLYIFYPYLRYM